MTRKVTLTGFALPPLTRLRWNVTTLATGAGEPDARRQSLEERWPDAANGVQALDRAEGAALITALHDSLCERWPHAREALDLVNRGSVNVHN